MTKLFQAFIQVDSSLARKFEGTGLGLAMVKQLAELHGGTVAVASAEGIGARFAAWLPLRTPAQAAPNPALTVRTDPVVVAAPAKRVALVVEDNEQTAEVIRLLLEAEGFTVLHAASAKAALLQAMQQTLSLITLDIQLPNRDGWTFLRQLRDGSLAQVPVIIISGMADCQMALNQGAATVLQKPITRTQLKFSLTHLGLQPAEEKTYTVLVVDDDPKAVEVMAAYLPAPAYAVIRAYTGSEAITLARSLRPDLIVLDLIMPDISGFQVVQALQRDADTLHIPVLVVTAKEITAQDCAALHSPDGAVIPITSKAGFNRSQFLDEVRRALQAH